MLVGARIAKDDPYVEIIHQDHSCYFVPSYEARALALKLLKAADEAETLGTWRLEHLARIILYLAEGRGPFPEDVQDCLEWAKQLGEK